MPDEKNSYGPSGDTDQQSSAFTPEPLSIKQGEMRKDSNGNSDQRQQEAKEIVREIHWVEKATMWSQIVLAVIGIAALVVYRGQLTVMQGQLKEARDAATVALDSVNIAKDSLRAAQRAWVSITHPAYLNWFVVDPSNKNYSIEYVFIIKNYGPGVALHVASHFDAVNIRSFRKTFQESCNDAAIYYTDRAIEEARGGYALFPNEETRVPGVQIGNMEQLDSDGPLYIVGCILYQDQFGVQHKTQTCFRTSDDMDLGAIRKKRQGLYACSSEAN
jgi:hypothetical protein